MGVFEHLTVLTLICMMMMMMMMMMMILFTLAHCTARRRDTSDACNYSRAANGCAHRGRHVAARGAHGFGMLARHSRPVRCFPPGVGPPLPP